MIDFNTTRKIRVLLGNALRVYAESVLSQHGADAWERSKAVQLQKHGGKGRLEKVDLGVAIGIILDNWARFKPHQDESFRTYLITVRAARNNWAHEDSLEELSLEQMQAVVVDSLRILKAIKADEPTLETFREMNQEISGLITQDASNVNGKTGPIDVTSNGMAGVEEAVSIPGVHGVALMPEPALPKEIEATTPVSASAASPSPPSATKAQSSLDRRWVAVGLATLVALTGIGAYFGFGKPAFATEKVVIGVLGDLERYDGLKTHLNNLLSSHYKLSANGLSITTVGGTRITYESAKDHIRNTDWDLVFAYSPMLSLTCKENGYRYVGRMFASKPSYYRSCLFVRKSSSIRSIKDINSRTVVALGSPNSASSFFMPIYDLYGSSFRLRSAERSATIKDMVTQGAADVGAVAEEALLESDLKKFRVIHHSRDIPGSGIYASHTLSENDFQAIRKAVLDAPDKVKKRIDYDGSPEPDYSEFTKIAQRAEWTIKCVDLNRNPVSLNCE